MPKLVSIIIPTYNRAHLLGETLDSILSQTYQEWECLVIDDGSTDHTPELVEFYQERDARISYHKRPKDRLKGANACRNFGFSKSKGQYINWFDSDDIMYPEKLERQLTDLERSSKPFGVCQSMVFERCTGKPLGLRTENVVAADIFHDYLTMRIGFMTPAVLWEKFFLKQMDYLFDEELQAAQEWEFHLRALNKITSYAIVNEPLVYIRKHEEGITYNKLEAKRFYHYFLARLKIYKNEQVILGAQSRNFLKDYLLKASKKMIVERNPYATEALRKFIFYENKMSVKAKVAACLSLISYALLKRGNIVLQKIQYSR